MSIVKEFKEFALRGNVVDMAVGIIIGASFGKIVSSMVSDVLMPPLGKLIGGVNFSDLFINLDPSKVLPNGSAVTTLAQAKEAGAAVIAYGQFINVAIDFVIVAVAVFAMVKAMNSMKGKNKEVPVAPTTKECQFCTMTVALKATRCPHCTSDLSARMAA